MERERELIQRALAGDQEACRRIVEDHHRMARAIVQGILGRRDEVEDVLQEVFVKVFRNLKKFRGEASLGTWIHRIARNEALRLLRRERRRVEVTAEELGEVAGAGSPGDAEGIDLRDLLEYALERIDEKERIAIELKYTGGCSYREIADMMDVPEGTVKTHVHRGKLALRRIIFAKLGRRTCGRKS